MNPWLQFAAARKIAAELQIKYCGQPMSVEDDMIQDLWEHDLYTEDMWLNVHWDDFDLVCWVQIGTQHDLVPR